MDSSPPFRLRTAIVVVCMITLPLIAVCGVKLPKLFSGFASDNGATAKAPAPKPAPGVSIKNAVAAGNPPLAASGVAEAHRHGGNQGGHESAGIVHTKGEAASDFDPNAANYPVVQASNNDVRAMDPTARTAEAAGIYPLPTTDAAPDQMMPPPVVVAEQFSTIQQRLRAMGATHYVLETWGPQGDMYRFQCRMSAGHHPGYSRQFEAIDSDALRVMQTVLDEIDAWKAGRLP
jgi:hypothetical protein